VCFEISEVEKDFLKKPKKFKGVLKK